MEVFEGRVTVLVSSVHSVQVAPVQGWARFVFTTVQMEKLRLSKGRDLPTESTAGPRPPALFIDLSRCGQKVRMAVWSPGSVNSGSLEGWGCRYLVD